MSNFVHADIEKEALRTGSLDQFMVVFECSAVMSEAAELEAKENEGKPHLHSPSRET